VTTDEDLRRLAEAAPDGPWIEDPDEPGVVMRPDGWDGEMVAVANGDFYRVIAAFIAAANPAAVLALLDRVAAAEAEVKRTRTLWKSDTDTLIERDKANHARAEKAEAEVEQLSGTDDPIPRYAQLDIWMALYGSNRSEGYGPFRDGHGFAETWAFLFSEVKRLSAWKADVLPVMAGLQDLGTALGVPLGVSITGEQAAERAAELVAENERLTRAVTTLDQTTDDLAASCAQVEAENAALRETVEAVALVVSRAASRMSLDANGNFAVSGVALIAALGGEA
jgi:hypothetical protein